MVLDSMSMPQNYFLMLLLCCQLACFWYLQGINLISVTFCSDTDSGCQSTLLNPSSEHNSSPKQAKPSLSLGLTKPCHCSIWGIALPAFTAAAQEISVSTSSHSSLKVQKEVKLQLLAEKSTLSEQSRALTTESAPKLWHKNCTQSLVFKYLKSSTTTKVAGGLS